MLSADLHVLRDEHVAALDPLDFDQRVGDLWRMNADADAKWLVTVLRDVTPAATDVADLGTAECLAAMRDLGMVIGSVKRHGMEPLDAVPDLEKVLIILGDRTGMVPRDTVHHYIRWNPTGPRERMYTGHRMERLLMSSVRVSLPRMSAAVDLCRQLWDISPNDLSFAVVAQELVALLRSMEDAIDIAVANVTPEFFARTMRPFFEDIRVGDRRFLGPAAAHVPLALVDMALWASDHGSPEYTKYAAESAWYGLPGWRDLFDEWVAGPSVVSRLKTAIAQANGATPPHLRAGAEAVARGLRALVAFRGKHLTMARKSYAHELRLYPLGSGGGSIDLLAEIVDVTKQNATQVRRWLDQPRRAGKRRVLCES